MGMSWSAHHGVIDLVVDRTERAVIENLSSGRSTWNVQLSHQGILIDGYRPWITAAELGGNALVLNVLLLEAIHDRLFAFYNKIDLETIRRRAQPPVDTEEIDDEVLAVSCQDVAGDDRAPEDDQTSQGSLSGRRLRPLRLEKLLLILANRFGCEVRTGKGDETVVFRPGGRIFRFGRPKQIQPELMKQVLQRLGIPLRDWLSMVYG